MITITLAPCPGVDKPFAAVTKETVAFSGADVPDGLQAALFDGAGTCLAIGDVAGGKAELDLDTQEAVDATAPVGPGEAVSVWLVVGDKDTHVATIPCKLIRNLIDDSAYHPPAPLPEYWTKEEVQAAIDAHAKRKDNPHHVTAAQVGAATPEAIAEALAEALAGALARAGCNQLTAPVKLIRKDGSANPVLLIGSQVDGEGMKEDCWTLALHYDRLVFRTTPGGEVHTLLFNRPGDDKANSDAIVLWKEMVAALAEATEGLIGADGGTVGGVLRMKNLKIATDDDTDHDIAVVPNAAGAGLQLQFPGGNTAMVRAKTGTLATVAEVNEKDASTLADAKAYADGKVAAVDTAMPEAPSDDHVPSTQLLKEQLNGKLSLTGGTLSGTLTLPRIQLTSTNPAYTFMYAQVPAQDTAVAPPVYGFFATRQSSTAGSTERQAFGIAPGSSVTRLSFLYGDNVTVGDQKVFGGYAWSLDRTFLMNDVWISDGIAVGSMNWWGLVQDGDELRIVKDKGTPKAYLPLAGGTVTGNVTFNGADNYMTALRFGGSAAAAGLKTRGICGWNGLNQKNGLFLNYDGREVSTEEYFSAGEGRGVYVCGGKDTTTKAAQVLRKMDGDTFYAPKTQTYTKAEVDEKITSALGDINAALAQI